MAPKKKTYVPTTLRPFTLLGFVLLCLGFIAGLEVMIRLGRGRIQDRGLQGIVLKRGAADGVFHRRFPNTIGGVTKHRIRRQDQPSTTNLNPKTTGDITQTGTVTRSLLSDRIPSPTT